MEEIRDCKIKKEIMLVRETENNNIRDEKQALEIFDFWNALGLVKHKNKGQLFKRSIIALMKCEYHEDEIKQAMLNYKEIIESDFFYSYVNNLQEFIKSKIDNFTDYGHQWRNYLTFKEREQKDLEDIQNGCIKVIGYSEMIQYLRDLPYEEYLLTAHWKHFSRETIKFYKKCIICDSEKELKVHHKSYSNRGRETFNDVICLCDKCHSKFHDKE